MVHLELIYVCGPSAFLMKSWQYCTYCPDQIYEEYMYEARHYFSHCGYGAMSLFQGEIIRGHGNFWLRKLKFPGPVLP